MKNDTEKLEKRLSRIDLAVNEEHMKRLEEELKYKINENLLESNSIVKDLGNISGFKVRKRLAAACGFAMLLILFINTAFAQDIFLRIISLFSFGTSFNYAVISEDDYESVDPFIDVRFYEMSDDEKCDYITKVNDDLIGQIFDENGNPLYKFYMDYYEAMGALKPDNANTEYITVRAYDSSGDRVIGAGISESGGKYTPITQKIIDDSKKTVNLSEAEEFIGAKIKLPSADYKPAKIVAENRNYIEPYTKLVYLYFMEKDSDELSFVVFCEKTDNFTNAYTFYLTREPNITNLGKIKLYEFFFPDSSGSMYKWKDGNLVYSMNHFTVNGDECIEIIKGMK